MLEVSGSSAPFPLSTTGLADLNALANPTQNLVNGYNIAEQTCFHRTTVNNLITTLGQLSATFKGLDDLLEESKKLVTHSSGVAAGAEGLVVSSTTLLGNTVTVGSLINIASTVTTLIGTLMTLVGNIIGNLTTIRDGALIAAIAAAAAAASCALFWVPGAGPFLLAAGAIATAALLAVIFFVIRNNVNFVMSNLGLINSAVGALTGPLGTLTTSLGAVNTALATIMPPLQGVAASLTDVGNALDTQKPLMTNTAGIMDSRKVTLQNFLARPAGQAYVPRAHLDDTYRDAVKIYQAALSALPATSNAVWLAILNDPENKRQLLSGLPPQLDRSLECADIPAPPIG